MIKAKMEIAIPCLYVTNTNIKNLSVEITPATRISDFAVALNFMGEDIGLPEDIKLYMGDIVSYALTMCGGGGKCDIIGDRFRAVLKRSEFDATKFRFSFTTVPRPYAPTDPTPPPATAPTPADQSGDCEDPTNPE
tara:strand:+ start:103 stop:510 length:408 start_codon:yes stop_codon:yes gene_type:complete